MQTYLSFRLRAVLNHRFGVRNRECRLLGHNVRFLDPAFFHTNFNEVFLDEEYYFETSSARPVIIDCGSNIGLTVLYFKHLYPDASIVAFEPQPDAFAALKANVESNNLSSVRLVNAAVVGNGEPEVTVYSDPSVPGDMKATAVKRIADLGHQPLKEVRVRAVRLSDYLPEHVDMLKLDVEGAELEVLEEAAPGLSRVDQMFVECHCDPGTRDTRISSIAGLLESRGFSCLIRSPMSPPLYRHRQEYHALLLYAFRPDGAAA